MDFSLTLPRTARSVGVMRDFLVAALHAAGVDAEDSADIVTAVSEACANVIDHGGPGPRYHVHARLAGARYHVEVSNTGPAFVPRDMPVPGSDAESGRGVALMCGLVDQVRFSGLSEGGTVVTLDKRLSRPPHHAFRAGPGRGSGRGTRLAAGPGTPSAATRKPA